MRNIPESIKDIIEASNFAKLVSVDQGVFAMNSGFRRVPQDTKATHVIVSENYFFDMRQMNLWVEILEDCLLAELVTASGSNFSSNTSLPYIEGGASSARFRIEDNAKMKVRVRCKMEGDVVVADFFKLPTTASEEGKHLFTVYSIFDTAGGEQAVEVSKAALTLVIGKLEEFGKECQTQMDLIMKEVAKLNNAKYYQSYLQSHAAEAKKLMETSAVIEKLKSSNPKFFKDYQPLFYYFHEWLQCEEETSPVSYRRFPATYGIKHGFMAAALAFSKKMTDKLKHGEVHVKAA